MKTPLAFFFAILSVMLPVFGQEIPNPSFEELEVDPSLEFITPGSPGFGMAVPLLQWAFGYHTGVCIEGRHHAEGVSAVDGHQVAFIQGQKDGFEDGSIPSHIFGVDVTGLEIGEEYEISWKQTGRTTDTGTAAVTVLIGDEIVPPVVLLARETVGTRGEWETKTGWFTATEPTMRLNILHSIDDAGDDPDDLPTTLFDDFQIRAVSSPNP
jgi:hypothetical protein